MQENLKVNAENGKHICFFIKSSENPESILDLFLKQIHTQFPNTTDVILSISYSLNEPWNQKIQKLVAHYFVLISNHNRQFEIKSFSVTSESEINLDNYVKNFNEIKIPLNLPQKNTITANFDFLFFQEQKKEYFDESKSVCFNPKEICFFDPIYIPKPWGQEIWYTGVEKRGVSKIKSAHNSNISIPIPWYFSALPKQLLGQKQAEQNLTLVKILDPLPDAVFGDLYYELHTEKNEVYIVTDISVPEGKIKFGSNLEILKQYNNNLDLYKKELLNIIQRYEKIRRKIDAIFDEFRAQSNISLNEPISASTIKEWLFKIPQELLAEEQSKRLEMDSFAGYLKLNIGDVVRVPILIPHALQHGVRVIEFQTPTYERLILSFAQKVLTQDHWDTKKALDIMQIVPPLKTELEVINKNEMYCEEQVCFFKEFRSSRMKIYSDKCIQFEAMESYRILFNVNGELSISVNASNFIEVKQGACIFIPPNIVFELKSQADSTILFCLPN